MIGASQDREAAHTLVAISNAIATLLREATGKGPRRCTAYWAGRDLLVVLLEGGYSDAEKTLFAGGGGGGLAVRASRHALQDLIAPRMTAVVQDLTGREVAAFMSASHQAPDLQLETFALVPATAS